MTAIYTIGYGGRAVDEFLALLRQHGITLLVDVRSQPYSKFNPDFTGSALRGILRGAGIDYRFMGDSLGGRPEDKGCFVKGKLNADECEKREWYQKGISQLIDLASKQRATIMCSEKDPLHCHRSYTIGVTLAKDDRCKVMHIDKEGELQEHANLIPARQLSFLGI